MVHDLIRSSSWIHTILLIAADDPARGARRHTAGGGAAAGASATMASKRQRTAERPAACPFAAFTESVGSMRDWLAMV